MGKLRLLFNLFLDEYYIKILGYKERLNMNSYVIPIEIYNHDIVFVTGKDEECINYLVKKFDMDENFLKDNINDKYGGCAINLSGGLIVCWVCDQNNQFNLFHEIEHCGNFILRNIGVNLDSNSEESYSYLKTHIFKLITEKIKKTKKRKVKKR